VTCLPQRSVWLWERYHHVYQHPLLFVSAEGISVRIETIPKLAYGLLTLPSNLSSSRARSSRSRRQAPPRRRPSASRGRRRLRARCTRATPWAGRCASRSAATRESSAAGSSTT
jgi:hypothetical protein